MADVPVGAALFLRFDRSRLDLFPACSHVVPIHKGGFRGLKHALPFSIPICVSVPVRSFYSRDCFFLGRPLKTEPVAAQATFWRLLNSSGQNKDNIRGKEEKFSSNFFACTDCTSKYLSDLHERAFDQFAQLAVSH